MGRTLRCLPSLVLRRNGILQGQAADGVVRRRTGMYKVRRGGFGVRR